MSGIKPDDSDWVRALNMLFRKGMLVRKTRFTKARARILLDQVHVWKIQLARRYPQAEYGENYPNSREGAGEDYCAAMQWIINQVSCRWAMKELYPENDRVNNFAEEVMNFKDKGGIVINIVLTKAMVRIIRNLSWEEKYRLEDDKDFYEAMQFLTNKMFVRWTIADLIEK